MIMNMPPSDFSVVLKIYLPDAAQTRKQEQ